MSKNPFKALVELENKKEKLGGECYRYFMKVVEPRVSEFIDSTFSEDIDWEYDDPFVSYSEEELFYLPHIEPTFIKYGDDVGFLIKPYSESDGAPVLDGPIELSATKIASTSYKKYFAGIKDMYNLDACDCRTTLISEQNRVIEQIKGLQKYLAELERKALYND